MPALREVESESVGEQLLKGEIKLTDEAFSALEPLLIEAGELPVTSVLEFLGIHDLTIHPELALQAIHARRGSGLGSGHGTDRTYVAKGYRYGAEPVEGCRLVP